MGSRSPAINAASILPGLLRDFGNVVDVLDQIAPRRVLVAAGVYEMARSPRSVQLTGEKFTKAPRVLTERFACY